MKVILHTKKINYKLSGIIAVSLLFLILCCGAQNGRKNENRQSKPIQIKGSDTMVNLVQAWAEKFSLEKGETNLSITGGGSGTGFAALLNKTCDICMSSRGIEDQEIETAKKSNIKPLEHIVGLDGLMVIVNPENNIDRLTLDQVRDIFMGTVKNWSEVGGKKSAIVILSRESNSGTHTFFKENVLRHGDKKGKEEFSPHALLMPSSQAIVNEVVQNPHAVGYVGLGYQSSQLKALLLAKPKTQDFIAPSIENVMSNLYPVSRPLFLYTDGEQHGVVKDFIEFALSGEGQVIVRELDFVPLVKKK
jgi:phosphate transport system substrate-binding protein